MALTEEQIKNLKPGDTIFLNNYPLTFRDSNIHGDVLANDNIAECNEGGICWFSKNYLSIDNATENKPKHDPCRLFKEGDEVRYCERDGRKIFRLHDGAIYEVKSNEGDAGTVEIWLWKEVGRYGSYPYNVFELVTPVEELEPYSIDPANSNVLFKHGKKFATFEDDDEAQEMCDRLNEEYRKEQSNDQTI